MGERIRLLVNNHGVSSILLSVAGFVTVVVGVHQGIFHVAPGYQGSVNAGGEPLGLRGWLLAGAGAVGVVGAVLSIRRKRLSVVPVVGGGIVLFEAFRTIVIAWNALPYPLFTETTYRRSGEPVMFILGAEPFMLIAGGILIVGAGIAGRRGYGEREDGDEMSSPQSTST